MSAVPIRPSCADIIAMYHRMKGEDVFFLTGTDEHGQKVQQAAEKNNLSPAEHCDIYAERFQELWSYFNISNDDFIRTTEARHIRVVQDLMQRLYDLGEIYKDDYEGWYSVADEMFVSEKDHAEGKYRDVRRISETNYYFRMSAYRQRLIDHIREHPGFIRPENRRNEILGFLKQPLKDLCISRPKARLAWGIELPFDEDYVTYVWFDALLNYISAPGYGADEEKFRRYWPAVHMIGKDILTTHCVYWPSMLMAAGIELPEAIFAHGWWTSEGKKMSKSLGNFIDLETIQSHCDHVGKDAYRYFMAKEGPLFSDADFSKERFYHTYNMDLANDFGNLVNRIFKLIKKYYGGKVPGPGTLQENEQEMKKAAEAVRDAVMEHLEALDVNAMVSEIIAYVSSVNRYLEQKEPWKLAKSDPDAAGRVLYAGLASLRFSAALLYPVLPQKTAEFFSMLNSGEKPGRIVQWEDLSPGTELDEMKALFPRFDMKRLETGD
ncbi:MAG: class I tRNA ligase family protein [Candidatus Marinimicrobia bacterium]|nr:class I tRNA ligase family protein [Candidatus Neomarinimicrobiota bacterium]